MARLGLVVATTLLPLAAQAQNTRPAPLTAAIRAAAPAQQDQIGGCIAKNMPVRLQSVCTAGTIDQVSACMRPEAIRRAQIKRSCAQTVLGASALH